MAPGGPFRGDREYTHSCGKQHELGQNPTPRMVEVDLVMQCVSKQAHILL